MISVKKFMIVISSLVMIVASAMLYYSGVFGAHFFLLRTTYDKLPGWEQDNQQKALLAFKQSCVAIMHLDSKKMFSTLLPSGGYVSAWQTICLAANKLTKNDDHTARQFFEYWFQPYRVANNFNPNGLFTGYYVPVIHARLKKNQRFQTPIYALPNTKPYPDRAAITAGALENKARVLTWSDDPIDVFFAQIQGSARVRLSPKKNFLIGYAGNNGRPYTAIGKILIEKRAIEKKNISMQSIRAWLNEHPQELHTILNQDASYVFFQIQKNNQPLGSQGVPLTPQRSLAVDPRFIPLGAPVWLNSSSPTRLTPNMTFQQLLIAQDTGGAIKGIVRGDVFWGEGDDAAYTAGYMRNKGQYWVLLPRFIQ